jgi:hypothetical protein
MPSRFPRNLSRHRLPSAAAIRRSSMGMFVGKAMAKSRNGMKNNVYFTSNRGLPLPQTII